MSLKTKGPVWVSTRKRIAELSDLIDRVIPRGWKRKRIAEALIRKMKKEGKLEAEKWREYIEELGIPKKEFYIVLNKLRRVGLVRKEGGHHRGVWKLSRQFSTALRDMADFWERWAFD